MTSKTEKGLTEGLLAGYGGKTNFTTVNREGFELKSSSLSEPGMTYVDQWLPRDTGGGQELLKIDEEEFTRLYAGGIAKEEVLNKLGISGKEIISHLIGRISALGGKTRLFANCHPEILGKWDYEYLLIEEEPGIGVRVAKETIKYDNQTVFVHYFLLAEVR